MSFFCLATLRTHYYYTLSTSGICLWCDPCPQHSQLDSVLPAVVMAAEELGQWSWEILVGDTECSSTQVLWQCNDSTMTIITVQGPLHAVEMFYRRKPDLFLGPVCPYVLAPVVRSVILHFDFNLIPSSRCVTLLIGIVEYSELGQQLIWIFSNR